MEQQPLATDGDPLMRTRLTNLLTVSLLVNAFALGVGVTHALGHRGDKYACGRHGEHRAHHAARAGNQPGPARSGERRFDRPAEARLLHSIVRTMGGPRDPRAQELLKASRSHMRETRNAIAAAQARVEAALLAQPYEEAKLQQALAKLNQQSQLAQANAQDLLQELAAKLTPEERKLLRNGESRDMPGARRKD